MRSFKFCLAVLLCGTIEGTAEVQNVALGGKAAQSSTFDASGATGGASKAIDGNRRSNGLLYPHNSCTHTALQKKPWWRVDLLKKYKVDSVIITNRGDCCPERLNGAELRIGNSLDDEGNNNPKCAVLHAGIPAGESKVFKCNGMEGRWVNVVIPGRKEYLTLCEVEVYGEPNDFQNVALGGKAAQSSTFDASGATGGASKAIDGNRRSNGLLYPHNSCTHTALQKKPWWRVDLLKKYKVDSVIITNRGDCCPERLNGAELRIGNSLDDEGNNNPKCAVLHAGIPAGESKVFKCYGMEGRWVNVVIPGRKEYLTLCEVEVYGEPSETSFKLHCADLA